MQFMARIRWLKTSPFVMYKYRLNWGCTCRTPIDAISIIPWNGKEIIVMIKIKLQVEFKWAGNYADLTNGPDILIRNRASCCWNECGWKQIEREQCPSLCSLLSCHINLIALDFTFVRFDNLYTIRCVYISFIDCQRARELVQVAFTGCDLILI